MSASLIPVEPDVLDSKEAFLIRDFVRFYADDEHRAIIETIVLERHPVISLRLLDWFVLRYAATHPVMLVRDSDPDHPFNVYDEYIYIRKHVTKDLFDVYRRHTRHYLRITAQRHVVVTRDPPDPTDQWSLVTTLGQLNFFMWAIQHSVIDYLNEHHASVRSDLDGPRSHRAATDACEAATPVVRINVGKHTLSFT